MGLQRYGPPLGAGAPRQSCAATMKRDRDSASRSRVPPPFGCSFPAIVINNAIVPIDRIRIEIEDNGLESARTVLEAAPRRLRAIPLTTATTVEGLPPPRLGGDPLFVSMAVSIVFGLVFAAVLTLGFVPALYCLLFRVRADRLASS